MSDIIDQLLPISTMTHFATGYSGIRVHLSLINVDIEQVVRAWPFLRGFVLPSKNFRLSPLTKICLTQLSCLADLSRLQIAIGEELIRIPIKNHCIGPAHDFIRHMFQRAVPVNS